MNLAKVGEIAERWMISTSKTADMAGLPDR